MDDRLFHLYWHDRLIGTITNISYIDFPWLGGIIAFEELSDNVRSALEYIDAALAEDYDRLPDVEFDVDPWEGWRIVAPDGKTIRMSPPVVDFVEGTVTWR
ncbi:hypothetical protein [Chamaesiphon polymorphus]|uniref:Uncharacterized protein n=1 Tax=Chamaesiphon polymorphus CCALA 037 TaxID=2107692 RepID=A0A2T1FYS3_9CYAN|nr:hypothetical protein [Chamaesiphon polymorphus]PSB50148.1 hypothetical protein C7B77_23120 [Chamaesiphon polymorphus CCALA 037]